MILGGDIGGTRTRLALHESGGTPARFDRTLQNRDFPDFDTALAHFLEGAGHPTVTAAAFAVAGPVLAGRVQLTNLGWVLDEVALGTRLGGARVRLLNDLQAAAHGVLRLPPGDLRVLATGESAPHGNVAVIGAGTGLGEALLTWADGHAIAIASEGGHADFAPHDATEFALLEWIARTREHVSWEHVVSGPGLVRLYTFLRDTARADEPAALRERIAAAVEPAMVISQAGIAGEFPICVQALEMFVRAYGAEAGNLALTGMALGGVYVTGGIAPHVLDGRWRALFVQAFCAKGRYEGFMRRIAVRVVLRGHASLVGAAAVASAA